VVGQPSTARDTAMRIVTFIAIESLFVAVAPMGCSSNTVTAAGDGMTPGGNTATSIGGASAKGGATSSVGAATATGGASASGGAGTAAGGATATGGMTGSGGATATGGAVGTGGTTGLGGGTGRGGATATGGTKSSGGSTSSGVTGGMSSSSGNTSRGGVSSGGSSFGGSAAGGAGTGGSAVGGATSANGGSTTGGGSAAGGATSANGGSATGGGAGTANGGASVDCTDASTFTKDLTLRYDGADIPVTGSTKTYRATTNWWHKFTDQKVSVNQIGFTIGNPSNVSSDASDGNPIGFPSIFIGSYSGATTVGSNLPKLVSELKSVPTVFSSNAGAPIDTSNLNATYDVWFTKTGTPLSKLQSSPGTGGAYLMVWMFKPSDRRPRGGAPSAGDNVANHLAHVVDGVAGTWDVWIDTTDPLCISYVSTSPLTSLSFDLNKFIRDSVTNNYGVTDAMYLSIVFAGFEIWSGGDGLNLKQFCAAVN
jgi:hypothetical protein